MGARAHNLILLAGLAAFLALVAWLAATLEPITGDLTRVGGLPERQWGWRGEQPRFAGLLHRVVHEPGVRPAADLLVFGDSFSQQDHRGHAWQALLAARTGLAIVTFHADTVDPLAVLASPPYRAAPPLAVIYQSSELSLAERLPAFATDCQPGTPIRPRAPRPVRPQTPVVVPQVRPHSHGWRLGPRIDETMHVLRLAAARAFGHSNVAVLPLTRTGLFTSRRQDLLVYGYAVRPRLPAALIGRLGCGLRDLARQVEASGAVFVPLLVPTKFSAYARYTPGGADPGFALPVLEAAGIAGPRLPTLLDAALTAGAVDLYLPNDSHWGPIGHRIAADAVYDDLIARGVLVERPGRGVTGEEPAQPIR